MKKILFLLAFVLSTGLLSAQQQWTVCFRGKTCLKNVEEDPAGNLIRISKAGLAKKGDLTIRFSTDDGTVYRHLMADDQNRSGIKGWENIGSSFSVNTGELKKLFEGRKKVLFYFTEIPRDPEKAALVRVRPVHLFTLELN